MLRITERDLTIMLILCISGHQIRVGIEKLFSLFLIQNLCCGNSKETVYEHPKHMFKLMGKTIITILRS